MINLGRTSEAIRYLQERIAEDPEFGEYHLRLMEAYILEEEFEIAADEIQQIRTTDIVEEKGMAIEAWVHARMGKTTEARQILTELEESSRPEVELESSP